MSARRSSDMAAISAAVQLGIERKQENTDLRSAIADELSSRGAASGDNDIDSVIAGLDEQDALNAKLQKASEQDAQDQLVLQQKQQSLLKQQAQATARSARQAIDSVKGRIGGLSMPGGLLLPIAVLLVLFTILIQINGNTRLGWIWLIVSGNASLPDQNAVGASGDFGPGATNTITPIGTSGASGNFGGGVPTSVTKTLAMPHFAFGDEVQL